MHYKNNTVRYLQYLEICIGKKINYTEFLPNAFITRWIPYTISTKVILILLINKIASEVEIKAPSRSLDGWSGASTIYS